MKHITTLLLLTSMLAIAQQLVVNPDFSDLDPQGRPRGWRIYQNVTVEKDTDGSNKLVIKDIQHSNASQTLPLKPEYGRLRLDFWMKTTSVVYGPEGWHTARLPMAFYDKDGKQVGGWPNVFGWCGSTNWRHCKRTYIIPENAVELRFSAALYGVSGTVEFKNITFTVIGEQSAKPGNVPCPIDPEVAQSLDGAWKQTSETRETISMNGLWQFRPVVDEKASDDQPPGENDCWGWFKLPARWPSTWVASHAFQEPLIAPYLEANFAEGLAKPTEIAWYKRTFTTPDHWTDKEITLDFSLLNTYAKVFVDNKPAAELWFPGGEIDLTGKLIPGKRQTLAILVKAIPLSNDGDAFMAPDRIIKQEATVKNKGISGNLELRAKPKGTKIDFVHIVTSTSRNTITFNAELLNVGDEPLVVKADVTLPDNSVKTFTSKPLKPNSDKIIPAKFTWKNAPIWDLDTPVLLKAKVAILDPKTGNVIDQTTPIDFGFREFTAGGKDLHLNGIPIHLRALHCDAGSNNWVRTNTKEDVEEMLRRMRLYGFNFLINGHYNFTYGFMNHLEGLLEAVQENGFLMSFSLPHLNAFNWKLHEQETRDRYEKTTRFVIRKVANNPAVVMYAMNHNAAGYYGDQNPLKIDGKYKYEPEGIDWSNPARQPGFERYFRRVQAKHSEYIAKKIDPTRLIYHHESGNLGDLHCVNIYLNWAPMQERSDWMEHWSKNGIKPVFFVEWGMPHISSWSSYRGPAFIWTTNAFQSLWAAEFAAAEIGEEAYRQAEEFGQRPLEIEEKLWATGEPFAWWQLNRGIKDYPFYRNILAKFVSDNWKSFRMQGVSAMLPWDQDILWEKPASTPPPEKHENLNDLKKPGIVPDVNSDDGGTRFIYGTSPASDWAPSPVGEAFLRYNMPTSAFFAGQKDQPTEKSHVFKPGEKLSKSIALINDTRQVRTVKGTWKLKDDDQVVHFTETVKPGQLEFIYLTIPIKDNMEATQQTLQMTATFDNADTWTDEFNFQVLPLEDKNQIPRTIVQLYDPKNLSTKTINKLPGVKIQKLKHDTPPNLDQVIVIGREALDEPVHIDWLANAVQNGNVLFLEQSYDALTEQLGFRANIHGLRELFHTKNPHQVIKGILDNPKDGKPFADINTAFANWRGNATLVPPYLDLDEREFSDPKWNWLDFSNTRVWRSGNRGCVASVLIEKPTIGNWHPILVGGFDLQYAPLLETIQDNGRTIFCQLNVSARTTQDPIAQKILLNILTYLDQAPKPQPPKKVLYAGGQEGENLLKALKIDYELLQGQPKTNHVLVLANGLDEKLLTPSTLTLDTTAMLAIGLDDKELNALGLKANPPEKVRSTALPNTTPDVLRGLTSADLYWHAILEQATLAVPEDQPEDKSNLWITMPTFSAIDNGTRQLVFQQVAPWHIDVDKKPYLRHSYRRAAFTTAKILANLGAKAQNPLVKQLEKRLGSKRFIDLTANWKYKIDPDVIGRDQKWFAWNVDTSTWKPYQPGTTLEDQVPELKDYDGYTWYAMRFQSPKFADDVTPTLNIGPCDDESWIWLNGNFLGETTKETNPEDYYKAHRFFKLDKGLLRTDGQPNTLVVLVNDTYLKGGMTGKPNITVPPPWLESYYVQDPIASDDPYRYYRW